MDDNIVHYDSALQMFLWSVGEEFDDDDLSEDELKKRVEKYKIKEGTASPNEKYKRGYTIFNHKNKTLVAFEGGTHNYIQSYNAEIYQQAVLDFLPDTPDEKETCNVQ